VGESVGEGQPVAGLAGLLLAAGVVDVLSPPEPLIALLPLKSLTEDHDTHALRVERETLVEVHDMEADWAGSRVADLEVEPLTEPAGVDVRLQVEAVLAALGG
jgi:hypothetical protein